MHSHHAYHFLLAPLDRYVKGDSGLAKVGAARVADCAGMDDWAPVKLVGMVEGWREKIFKDGGGKIAFFELEDLTGRVSVKVRAREIDQFAHVLTSGVKASKAGLFHVRRPSRLNRRKPVLLAAASPREGMRHGTRRSWNSSRVSVKPDARRNETL